MTSFQPDPRSTPAHGRLQAIIQAGCVVLVVGMLVPFAAGLPVRLRELRTLTSEAEPRLLFGLPPGLEAAYNSRLGPAEAGALGALGLSLQAYAAYLLTFEVALALVCTVVGLFIFYRRSEGWLTLWVSLLLVLLGTNSVSPEVPALASTVWLGWGSLYTSAGMLGMVSNVHILFLTPDGRFVPRWTLRLAAGFTGGMLALALYVVPGARYWGSLASLVIIFLALPAWVILLGVGIFSQVYRYRHVSGPVERQQIKWVALGLAAVTLGFLLNGTLLYAAVQVTGLARVLYFLARAALVNLCLMALPVCLAFSILRYRLWDVDLIIRRTLIYSLLTGLLALAALSLIVVLERLLRSITGHGQNQLVTVISTLAIAAVSGAVRVAVQAFIDRRFYRRKYNAARTLAAFAAAARDEVDLDALTGRLLAVVDATMQPATVQLWLKPARAGPAPQTPQRGVSTQDGAV